MTIYGAICTVREYTPYSAAGEKAINLCNGRGVYPYEQIYLHGYYIDRWQAAIIESLLMAELREEVLNG